MHSKMSRLHEEIILKNEMKKDHKKVLQAEKKPHTNPTFLILKQLFI